METTAITMFIYDAMQQEFLLHHLLSRVWGKQFAVRKQNWVILNNDGMKKYGGR